jgi:glycosyltransferase involved in cell wall biosynthesis
MKIAQVAPVFERVPPKRYGGTERVISYLTEELVRQGHDVTLFATGDSVTKAKLVSPIEQSKRFDTTRQEWLVYQSVMMDQLVEVALEFDLIHFHTDYFHFPILRKLQVPHLTTLHGRLDLPELVPLYRHFDHVPVVSISESQRLPLSWVNWLSTVHHGLPENQYHFSAAPEDYFVFVGRASPEKGLDQAIEIALRCGVPLRIAAKVDKQDEAYFEKVVSPLLGHPLIDFIGEVGEPEKQVLIANAKAFLFLIDWPEPFGMVMIEAFACGTPVIAYRHGSVPEIMEDGVTGFIVDDLEQAIQAAGRIGSIDRRLCRKKFEDRFTAERMAQDYLQIYHRIQSEKILANGVMHGKQNSAWRAMVHPRNLFTR